MKPYKPLQPPKETLPENASAAEVRAYNDRQLKRLDNHLNRYFARQAKTSSK